MTREVVRDNQDKQWTKRGEIVRGGQMVRNGQKPERRRGQLGRVMRLGRGHQTEEKQPGMLEIIRDRKERWSVKARNDRMVIDWQLVRVRDGRRAREIAKGDQREERWPEEAREERQTEAAGEKSGR